MRHTRLRKLISRGLLLVLVVIMLCASVLDVAAASPKSTKSVSATLAYTLKGLPLGRAVQNFYIGSTYIYCTQRVDGTTYLNRLKIEGNSRWMPVSPGVSGMQPRDPCRPWRGTLASGHKPR